MRFPARTAVILLLLVTTAAHATRIRRLSLTEIRDRAAEVLIVDAIESSSRVGRAGMIWTDHRLRVVEVLRGTRRAGDSLVLPFAGGRAGSSSVGIAGMTYLTPGTRYVIFLDRGLDLAMPSVGWSQGLFRVTPERIVSLDGELLVIDREGRIGRASPSRSQSTGRLADPVVLNANGTVAVQRRDEPRLSSDERREATIEDVRRFMRSQIRERSERTTVR